MKRAFKILAGLGLGVVLLLAGVGAYFKFFFDPNDIRALTHDVAMMTGVDMVGLGGRTPWWKKF